MGINKPESTFENADAQVEKVDHQKLSADNRLEQFDALKKEEANTQVDEQTLDEILASGYNDAPAPRPSAAVREQFSVNAEKLIATTNQQIAKKFGATAFARWNPEQFD